MSSISEPVRHQRQSKPAQPSSRRERRAAKARDHATLNRPANSGTIIEARDLYKDYHKGRLTVPVLKGATLSIKQGEFCAILGKSGSGKSTLLHLLGTLDSPTKGEIHYQQTRIDNLAPRKRDQLRNHEFGLIFQFYHLLPELSTLENVLMPRMISDGPFRYWANRKKHAERAKQLLDLVGLSHRLKHRPSELSGGEMQRVAIARALVSKPKLLLADEPTGNLDAANGAEVLGILQKLRSEEQLTVVMVTHDESIADRADRCIRLQNGRVVEAF
jgi:lipoprotein-releasing system ATP-binding protein